MTMTAVFPNGFTARLFILSSPFHLFRSNADNFFYWNEMGERQHICTLSIENWAKLHGIQVYGTKSSNADQYRQDDSYQQIHQSKNNGVAYQIRKRVRPNDSN